MRISDWSSDVCSSDLDPLLRECVIVEAFALRHRARDTDRQRVGDRDIEHPRQAPRFEAAGLDLHLAFKAVARKRGDDIDDARGRVAAIERALRTAQHLDTLEVEEFGYEHGRA